MRYLLLYLLSSCLLCGVGEKRLLVIIDTGLDLSDDALRKSRLSPSLVNRYDGVKGGLADVSWGVPRSRIRPSWDFVADSPKLQDLNGHGTHVTGIVWDELKAMNQAQGPCLAMLRAGTDRLNVSNLMKALQRVGELKEAGFDIPVVLMPFALERKDASMEEFEMFSKAVLELAESGTVVVTATANLGRDLDQLDGGARYSPGCLKHPNILTITSCSENGFLAPRASWGKETVFTAAPGSRIESQWLGKDRKKLSGSSQAAALVAAKAFHLLTSGPRPVKVDQLRETLTKSVRVQASLLDKCQTRGFIGSAAK